MRMIRTLAATGLLTLAATGALASTHDLAGIDQAVARFTGAPTGQPGGARLPVDRRLKLSNCPEPLALEWHGGAAQTVLVRCPVAGGWRLFVPVEGGGQQAAKAQPVVARGEAVAIAVEGRGFTLSRQGEALEAGAIGEWIRVRPVGGKSDAVRARVIQPGRVAIALP
jgi:flagellar basal body P-ring formation protein FlgA